MWHPERGFMDPGLIKKIQRIVKELALTRAETEVMFFYSERVQAKLKLPVSVSRSWSKLENKLVFSN
jgi:hypothetical protein